MRWISLILAGFIISGCKFAVLVSSGGDVASLSGTRDCSGPDFCEFDVDAPGFSETFTAVPRPGFEFVQWREGSGFYCGGLTSTTCVISVPNDALGAVVVAMYSTGHIMPIFKDVGFDTDGDGVFDREDEDDDNDGVLDVDDLCPLDPNPNCGFPVENVLIGDKEWAQVNQFVGVSWNEVNTVCPSGFCGGLINGYDMTGWRWATVDEIKFLFNTFIGSTQLYPGVDSYQDPQIAGGFVGSALSWDNDLFDYCFNGGPQTTNATIFEFEATQLNINCDIPGVWLSGLVRDASGPQDMPATASLSYAIYSSASIHYQELGVAGAWFYRSVP